MNLHDHPPAGGPMHGARQADPCVRADDSGPVIGDVLTRARASGPVRRWPGVVLALALVCGGHAAVLWALTVTFSRAPAVRVIPPAIVGVLVPEGLLVTPPEALPIAVEPQPTPVVSRPEPVPVPPVQAPPSERAVSLPPSQPPAAVEREDVPEGAPHSTARQNAEADGTEQPVVPPRADAAFLDNPAPRYPQASRRLREEGRVLLDVFIRADGTVGELKLKRSSGFPRLDDTALDAVRRWRYVPAMRGQDPVDYWHVQPLDFELNR